MKFAKIAAAVSLVLSGFTAFTLVMMLAAAGSRTCAVGPFWFYGMLSCAAAAVPGLAALLAQDQEAGPKMNILRRAPLVVCALLGVALVIFRLATGRMHYW